MYTTGKIGAYLLEFVENLLEIGLTLLFLGVIILK
jgi:hypothetical protein